MHLICLSIAHNLYVEIQVGACVYDSLVVPGSQRPYKPGRKVHPANFLGVLRKGSFSIANSRWPLENHASFVWKHLA